MRSVYLLVFLFLYVISPGQAQPKEISVNYYFSTGDYMEDKLSDDQVILEIIEMGDDFIYVKDFLDPLTGKKSSTGKKAWAIGYENNAYVHLVYSNNAPAPDLFIRLDTKGRFCLAVMDEEFMPSMEKAIHYNKYTGKIYHPEGRVTTDGDYLTSAGELKRIFIIDTKDLSIVLPYKAKNAPIDLLSKSTLKWLVGKDNFKGSKKEYTVEEVIAIVEDLNRRQ